MSQPDSAHATVHRARPAAAAPLRVVSERVRPDDVSPAATGPAQMRAASRDAASTPAPFPLAPRPEPWPEPTWPPRAPAPGALEPAAPDTSSGRPVRLAVVPPPVGSALPPGPVTPDAVRSGAAALVPARSLLPVPAGPMPSRSLLARLLDLLSGRRDPAGRHRPASIQSPAWSMCAPRRRRRSWWRAR